MGLDCYARVVVGVSVKKFHKAETVVKQITRYNEVTGEPYKKKGCKFRQAYIRQQRISCVWPCVR